MEKLVDRNNFETIGWCLEDFEASSMIFAGEAYTEFINQNIIKTDGINPETVLEALVNIEGLVSELNSGSRVIPDTTKQVAEQTFMLEIHRLYSGITSSFLLGGMASTLGVEPNYLAGHSRIIGRLLREDYPSVKII